MTKPKDEKPKDDPKVRSITLNPNPKGEFKLVGGSLADDWNMRLLNNVGSTLPMNHADIDASNKALLSTSKKWKQRRMQLVRT